MWAQWLAAAVGVWVMAAPAALGYGGALATSDRVAGPLAVSAGMVAAFSATRAVRWANVPIGVWIASAPVLLGGEASAMAGGAAAGLAIAGLSLVRGRVHPCMGGGWRALWKTDLLAQGR